MQSRSDEELTRMSGSQPADGSGQKISDTFIPEERGIRRLAFNLSLIGIISYQGWVSEREIFLDSDAYWLRIMGGLATWVLMILRARNIGLSPSRIVLGIFLIPILWAGLGLLLPILEDSIRPNFGPPNAILMGSIWLLVMLPVLAPVILLAVIKTNRFGKSRGYLRESGLSSDRSPCGFGGWLVLFVVSRVVWFPLFFVQSMFEGHRPYTLSSYEASEAEEKVIQELSTRGFDVGIFTFFEGVGLIALGAFISNLLVKEKSVAPQLAKLLCGYLVLSALGISVWNYMIGTDVLLMANSLNVTNPEILSALEALRIPKGVRLIDKLVGLSFILAWFFYFTYSKRVKATYLPKTTSTTSA